MGIIFQYGSNTDTTQLNSDDRLKGKAQCMGLASTVEPYVFKLGVPSKKHGCTATIEPGGKDLAWGVLYEVPDHIIERDTRTPRRWKSLDEIEAEGKNTRRTTIRVRRVGGDAVSAITYVGLRTEEGLKTTEAYAEYILRGLKSHGAPAEYVRKVRETIIANNPEIESKMLDQGLQKRREHNEELRTAPALEEFHRLIGHLFAQRRIPALSKDFKVDAFHEWSDQLCRKFGRDPDALSRSCSEAYWSIPDIQLALGHCLWVVERGRLTCGYDKAEAKIESVWIALDDIYFWYYVSCVWEMIYRSWERVAKLLALVLLSDMEKRYYDGVIAEIETRFPVVGQMQAFRRLKRMVRAWSTVASRRNSLTHISSSVFSYLEIKFRERAILGPNGQPLFVDVTTFPDPKRELQTLISHYTNVGRLLLQVHQFLDECAKSSVGTRSRLGPRRR